MPNAGHGMFDSLKERDDETERTLNFVTNVHFQMIYFLPTHNN